MGLFGRKSSRKPVAAPEPNVDTDTSAESHQFATAVRGGNLDEASALIDRRLASPDRLDPPLTLLDRAATARLALREGRLDDAAAILIHWESPYAGDLLEPTHRARINTLGLCLIGYFEHPDSQQHAAFDQLMDRKLRDVGKETNRSGDPYFGNVYASVKSQRELNRAR